MSVTAIPRSNADDGTGGGTPDFAVGVHRLIAVSDEFYDEAATTWMMHGACRRSDPELFFPISVKGRAVGQVNSAKAVCRRCLVQRQCLSYALQTMPEGIWGGTTQEERIVMRARPGATVKLP